MQLNCVAEYEGMVQVADTDNEVEEGKNEEIEEWMNWVLILLRMQ